MPGEGNQFFAAEEYADLTELRALAELIGPFGMRYMGERLMSHVASQVDELKVQLENEIWVLLEGAYLVM